VTTHQQFAALLEAISDEPVVAVDTESNSLHAYQEQVCLIQFSIPHADYLLDPLAELDLSSLGPFFANAGTQKVFHAAEYDVMCLKRDFGFRFANLFDTMWAARILGWPRIGLGALLQELFDVHTKKRYQRYNWGRRPLDQEALTYACVDTHFLLPLRRLQASALAEKGRQEEAQEMFDQVARSEPACHTFDPQDFWRIKGAFDLSTREQSILRELYIWRDREARRVNRPLFKVLSDRALVALARARPRSLKKLTKVDGVNEYHAHRFGKRILRAIDQGKRARPPSPPAPPPRRSREELDRFEALRTWRKGVAIERGVDPDVVISNATLWALAEHTPQRLDELHAIDGIGPWKRKTYGEAILMVLNAESRAARAR
jgi:ribonuclease D